MVTQGRATKDTLLVAQMENYSKQKQAKITIFSVTLIESYFIVICAMETSMDYFVGINCVVFLLQFKDKNDYK